MRAIICDTWGGEELLKLKNLPSPIPKDDELVIKVYAAGVNFPDTLIIRKLYQVKPQLPFTPGNEVAGIVISAGAKISKFAVGDRVLALIGVGAFCEEVAVGEKSCTKIPDHMEYAAAAGFMLAYGTSWHAVRDRAALQPGETMLVLGASGGVGLAAVEIGKAIGAKVVAAASTDEKCETARAHGADQVINYTNEDLRAGIKRTCGAGLNVIYDPVGGAFSEAAFRSIAWRGRHVVVGFANGAIPSIPLNLPLLKGASIVGVQYGHFFNFEPAQNAAGVAEMFTWFEEKKIRPLISKTYTLEETPIALADMGARKVTGKIVILPN
jgi:NADPH2:quinone reductase